MPEHIVMPRIAPAMESGRVIEFHKKEGEDIKQGEIFAEVESEKVIFQIESLYDGKIYKILCHEGDEVNINMPLAIVLLSGETSDSVNEMQTEITKQRPIVSDHDIKEKMEDGQSGRIKASPLAKKIAKEHNVDLNSITGNGHCGRIEKADVLRFVEARATSAENVGTSQISTNNLEITRIPFSGIRKTTAQNLQRSKDNVVPVTSITEVDVTELMKLYKKIKNTWAEENGIGVTLNAFLLSAVAHALKENLLLNSILEENYIKLNPEININLAMNIKGKLFIPVIRYADTLTVKEIANKIVYFKEKANEGTLTIDDMSGGTFTVTNVGPFDVKITTPVINYPQVAILAIGKIEKQPKFDENEQIVPRFLCYLSLTYDHRIIDGVPAAMFKKKIKELLANPYTLLS